jgi:hypothetical protein
MNTNVRGLDGPLLRSRGTDGGRGGGAGVVLVGRTKGAGLRHTPFACCLGCHPGMAGGLPGEV